MARHAIFTVRKRGAMNDDAQVAFTTLFGPKLQVLDGVVHNHDEYSLFS